VHRITNSIEQALEEKNVAPPSTWMWRKPLIRYGTRDWTANWELSYPSNAQKSWNLTKQRVSL